MLPDIPPPYSARVDSSGRIVVPAELRDRLRFRPGDELVLREVAGSLTVKTYDQVLAEAQAYFTSLAPPGVSMVDELIAERRAEAIREAAKDAAADV
ncbi:MAG: AbrB/MazE/SpoVT family DNA-binding domain-containing protein [Planctomycetaceae bacterium]|nr:AbrB/MazE/SpoVT family DNA-binding domain-containing protein [Planctomycetaceae bacterium]